MPEDVRREAERAYNRLGEAREYGWDTLISAYDRTTGEAVAFACVTHEDSSKDEGWTRGYEPLAILVEDAEKVFEQYSLTPVPVQIHSAPARVPFADETGGSYHVVIETPDLYSADQRLAATDFYTSDKSAFTAKIKAIKILRKLLGINLKPAKDLVEGCVLNQTFDFTQDTKPTVWVTSTFTPKEIGQ